MDETKLKCVGNQVNFIHLERGKQYVALNIDHKFHYRFEVINRGELYCNGNYCELGKEKWATGVGSFHKNTYRFYEYIEDKASKDEYQIF